MNSLRVLLVLVLCVPAVAAPKNPKPAKGADLQGFAAPVFNEDGSFTNTITASGTGGGLGNYVWRSTESSQLLASGQHLITGTFTIETRKSVQSGTYSAIGTPDANGFLNVDGTYVVTSGGSGTGTIAGNWRLSPPFEFHGTMSN